MWYLSVTMALRSVKSGSIKDKRNGHKSNGGRRGAKGREYGRGHRVPLSANWPAK
ncbi:MAG: hypothetical protein HQ522_01135 [Bacteroidetes bacterium]|nr:hypothetical protein [Bacteroidota bacterium]